MTLKQFLPYVPESLRDLYLKRKYDKQLNTWERSGRPLPTPHVVKQLVIKSFQKKHGINTLVETGTYRGDMTYAQRKFFKKIYTIELSEELCRMSAARLKKYKNIEVIQGDSGIVLGRIIKDINDITIFWLDGHYSGGITAKGNTDCPILNEIDTVLGSKIEHIILIDDAHEFNGKGDYPSLKALESKIKESEFPNSSFEVKDDIIRIELKA